MQLPSKIFSLRLNTCLTKTLRIRFVTSVATSLFSLCSMQALAFDTSDVVNQTPLKLEFTRLDTNNDGLLTPEEASHDKDLIGQFSNADTNKDGVLIADEYVDYKSAAQQKQINAFFNDSIVTSRIKEALLKNDCLRGLAIGVSTSQGRVILSGFIDTIKQEKCATAIASSTQGVQSVQTILIVKG